MIILAACNKCSQQFDVSSRKPGETIQCRCGGRIAVCEARAEETRLVRCTSCGAVRGAGGQNCEFCGARFSTVDKGWGTICPGCYCRLPNDAEFCVECGIKINVRKLTAAETDFKCPRCLVGLHVRMLDTVRIYECAGCGGMWVPESEFENICTRKEILSSVKTSAGIKSGGRRKFELSTKEEVKYIPCPECRALMNRRNYSHISGVIIDTCRDHGVWLDNQELSRIIQFIEKGGIERAHEVQAAERLHQSKMQETSPHSASIPLSPLSAGERPEDSLSVNARLACEAISFLARSFFK